MASVNWVDVQVWTTLLTGSGWVYSHTAFQENKNNNSDKWNKNKWGSQHKLCEYDSKIWKKTRHLSKGQHLTVVSDHREASLVRRPIGDLICGTAAGVLSLNSKAPGSAVVLTPWGRHIHGMSKGVNIWPGWMTYPLRKSKSERPPTASPLWQWNLYSYINSWTAPSNHSAVPGFKNPH